METDDQNLKRMLGLRATRESRIIVMLRQRGGEMYAREVGEALEFSVRTAGDVLRAMQKKKLLTSRLIRQWDNSGPGRRYYRLPDRKG